MLATDISASNCLLKWVSGVAVNGIFIKNRVARWNNDTIDNLGDFIIPEGWTIEYV